MAKALLKKGDVVYGPSVAVETIRAWLILVDESPTNNYVIGQNISAKKEFKHVLDSGDVAIYKKAPYALVQRARNICKEYLGPSSSGKDA